MNPLRMLLALIALTLPIQAAITPLELRCEGMGGIPAVTATPALSWRVESPERGQFQKSWQIIVSSSEALLASEKGDLWDSGKTPATRSPLVIYAGARLVAGQLCHWKVRSWDAADKASEWSKPAAWEVAPLSPADWQGARWIDDGREIPKNDTDFYKPDPAPLIRHEFTVSKPVVRARLHVAGLGVCVPSLNGGRVGDHVFAPPWTAFNKRVLFSTYDVTSQLASGGNCLGFALGNGWFNPLPLRMWGQRNIRDTLATGRPRVIACLVIEHPDGSTTKVVTGHDWQTAPGEVVSNSVYLGEVRDARLAMPSWNKPGFDATAWKAVRVNDATLETLRPLMTPPVRAGKPIPAVAVTTPKPGVHIVDLGKNSSGVPEVDLTAPAGTKVTFRYGELLNPDGSLNPMTSVCGQIKGMRKNSGNPPVSVGGPGAPEIAWQQDVYITRGGGETFRPELTFHAFRYMEVTGLPEAPAAISIRGIPLHSDIADAGEFSCSSEHLNRIQQMCRDTFLSNVVSVQSDCPHRERFGYGGDIAATSETFMMNFDMSGFYSKVVRDWADAAAPDGHLPDTAPFVGIDYCGVGWGMVHPILLEQLRQNYGATAILEEQVPVALRWLDSEAAKLKDGLVVKGLTDHEALSRNRGPEQTTPMFIDAARRVGRLARLIGRNADAERCMKMADESAAAWARNFLKEDGKVGDGSQSSQAFALGFGAAPEQDRPKVFEQLLEALKAPDGPRLSTGIFGTRFLLEELSRHGHSAEAFALADRKTFPSWGWMLENKATTLWEHWAWSDNTFSHNHPMFGSISGWFFRWLGGIQAADDAVGFDRIVIRPQVVPGLGWVKCSHRTVRGVIESNWSVVPDGRKFEIVIPTDATAIIGLPAGADDIVSEGGKPITESKEIESLKSEPASRLLRVGGGRYQFLVSHK